MSIFLGISRSYVVLLSQVRVYIYHQCNHCAALSFNNPASYYCELIMAFSAEIRIIEDNIISLLKNKDQRGMELLYDKYGDAIYGFLYKVLQSDELAETALDEVFLRVWRNIPMYDSKKMRLLTWVINIARQNAHQKLKNPQLSKSNNSSPNNHFFESYNPEGNNIKDLLKQVDKKQKQILEQIYFEGKEINEVSNNSDLPASNLKSMVRSVLKMLQASPLLVYK